jgi:hypothetical protein
MRADREAPTLQPGSRLAARRSSSGRTGGRRCGWLGRDTVCPFRWRGADGGTPTSRRARRVDFDGQPVVPAESSKSG